MHICSVAMHDFDLLQQLKDQAEAAKVPLRKALAKAGVATTNLGRWKSGATAPTQKTAQRIAEAIRDLAREKAA